jgi:hypothetical protein
VCIFCDMPIYTATTLSKDESIDYHMSVLSSCNISDLDLKVYSKSFECVNIHIRLTPLLGKYVSFYFLRPVFFSCIIRS